jgi:Peptidase S24-like
MINHHFRWPATACFAGSGTASSGRSSSRSWATTFLSTASAWNRMPRDRAMAAASAPRSSVAISFGSPASESGVTRLDLNDILIRHPQATFLMHIAGDSMRQAGVDDGDLALVDRAVNVVHGQVVIAILNDEFVCRRACSVAATTCDCRRRTRPAPTGCPAKVRNCRPGASSPTWSGRFRFEPPPSCSPLST